MRARRVAILAINPWQNVGTPFQPFSYAAYVVQAAIVADPAFEGIDVQVIEGRGFTVADWQAALEDLDPDVVGASAYVWSLPMFMPVLRAYRRARPDAVIVLGGPAARLEMLALEPYRQAAEFIDALVLADLVEPMLQVIAAWPRRDLADIHGLAVANGGEFRRTGEAAPRGADPPSPFQLGLAPRNVSAHLQTYYGCPMKCSFCAWGVGDGRTVVSSSDHLAAELAAFRDLGANAVMSVDAGLNLNPRAFDHLIEAEEKVGFLAEVPFHTEIYPSLVNEQMLRFLKGVRLAEVGIGLQSFDPGVTKRLDRYFEVSRFERVVEMLAGFAVVKVEIILGLPGDTPESFKATLQRVLALPCSVQVFHCLVLPDALMTRALPGDVLDYDPISLQIRACRGWQPDDITRAAAELDEEAAARGGLVSTQWPKHTATRDVPARLGEIPAAPMWYFPKGLH